MAKYAVLGKEASRLNHRCEFCIECAEVFRLMMTLFSFSTMSSCRPNAVFGFSLKSFSI
jgi:hypothetical protein